MTAALTLPPQDAPVSQRLAAVLRAVRMLTPPARLRVNGSPAFATSEAARAAWTMLAADLQAYALLAGIPADSALSGVPRDLRAAHALWAEVRDATTARLTQEARGHARTRSPFAEHVLAARAAAAKVATAVDRLFEDLAEGRL